MPDEPVALKPNMDTKGHNDAPVSKIASPEKLLSVPFATHSPPPLPSPENYAGECSDKHLSLDSDEKEPPNAPGWWFLFSLRQKLLLQEAPNN